MYHCQFHPNFNYLHNKSTKRDISVSGPSNGGDPNLRPGVWSSLSDGVAGQTWQSYNTIAIG